LNLNWWHLILKEINQNFKHQRKKKKGGTSHKM